MSREQERMRLIEAVLDGSASAPDRAAFNAACLRDPAFRRAYIVQATVHSLALDDAEAMRAVFPRRSRLPGFLRLAAAAALVAILAGGAVAAVLRLRASAPVPVPAVSPEPAPAALPPATNPVPAPAAAAAVTPQATNATPAESATNLVQQQTKGDTEMNIQKVALQATAAASLALVPAPAAVAESAAAAAGTSLCSPVHAIETRLADVAFTPERVLDTSAPIGTIYRFF